MFQFVYWFISDSAWGNGRTNCVESIHNIEKTQQDSKPCSLLAAQSNQVHLKYKYADEQTIQDQIGDYGHALWLIAIARERDGEIASLNEEEVGLQRDVVFGGDREMNQ